MYDDIFLEEAKKLLERVLEEHCDTNSTHEISPELKGDIDVFTKTLNL
ncbi:hypothetical protein [Dokdonia sp.]